MAKIQVMMRVRLADGQRVWAKPAPAGKGRFKAGYALINGEPEHHPDAVYHLRFTEGGKRRWEAVGTDLDAALAARDRKQHELQGVKLGLAPAPAAEGRKRLEDAIPDYTDELTNRKAAKTASGAKNLLAQFRAIVGIEAQLSSTKERSVEISN